jgi:hypothetical protein
MIDDAILRFLERHLLVWGAVVGVRNKHSYTGTLMTLMERIHADLF